MPPSVVLMLLAKVKMDSLYDEFHCIAISTDAVGRLVLEVDDAAVDRVLLAVDVGDEVADAALVLEGDALAVGALVVEVDAQALGEEGRLAQALGEHAVVVVDLFEDVGVGA